MIRLTELQRRNLQEIAAMDDDNINYSDIPEWTPAQWARTVRGPGAWKIARARAEASRPAWEAFRAGVAPITETDSFKDWFNGSKAVTENGEPQVLFHKSASCADKVFSSPGQVDAEYGEDFGLGIYCYAAPDTAQIYGGPAAAISGDASPGWLMPVYLCAVNPLALRTGKDLKDLWEGAGGKGAWNAKTPEEKAEYILNLGHDSVRAYQWDQWVAYRPTQIRIAIDSNADLAVSLARDLLKGLLSRF